MSVPTARTIGRITMAPTVWLMKVVAMSTRQQNIASTCGSPSQGSIMLQPCVLIHWRTHWGTPPSDWPRHFQVSSAAKGAASCAAAGS